MPARWSSTLAIAVVLALGAAARADTADWNQFVDKNPSGPVAKTPPKVAPAKTKPTATRAPAKVAAKAKPKPRAKPGHR